MVDHAREMCPKCCHIHCTASAWQHEEVNIPNHACDVWKARRTSANTGKPIGPLEHCGCNYWQEVEK